MKTKSCSIVMLAVLALFGRAEAGWLTFPPTPDPRIPGVNDPWIERPSFETRVFGGPPAGTGCGDPAKTELVDALLSGNQCEGWPPNPGGQDLAVVGVFDRIGVESAITGGVYVGPEDERLTAEAVMVSEARRVEGNLWAYRWEITNRGTGAMLEYFDGPREGPQFGAIAPGATRTETRYPRRLDGLFTGPPAVGAWGGLWAAESRFNDVSVIPDVLVEGFGTPDGVGLAPPRLHPLGLTEFEGEPPPPPFRVPEPSAGVLALTGGMLLLGLVVYTRRRPVA